MGIRKSLEPVSALEVVGRAQVASDRPMGPTCADVITRIEALDYLPRASKQQLKWAVNLVVRGIGTDLSATPADADWIRRHVNKWEGARFGVADSTLTMARSQFNRALMLAGFSAQKADSRQLAPAWKSLELVLQKHWSSRKKSEGLYWLRMRLRSFSKWCSDQDILPEQVNDGVIDQFILSGKRSPLRGASADTGRKLRAAWNRAVRELPSWPSNTVSDSKTPEKVNTRFDEQAFPRSFIADLDAYQANKGFLRPPEDIAHPGASLLERVQRRRAQLKSARSDSNPAPRPKRRLQPLGEKTLYSQRRFLIRAATALVEAGLKQIENIRSIADAVCPESVAALIDQIEARRALGAPTTRYCAWLVQEFISIAVRCDIDLALDDVQTLGELVQILRAGIDIPDGTLSPKARMCVAQFDDPDNFALLVACSEWEMTTLEAQRRRTGVVTESMAKCAKAAIGNHIMCILPVRRETLATTCRHRNFRAPMRRGGNATLMYYEDQVKNDVQLEAIVGPRKWELIETYCKHYRPVLSGAAGNQYLFPGSTPAGHSSPQAIADAITKFVRQRTGLSMTLHKYRHVMSAKLLEKEKRLDLTKALLGHTLGIGATGHYVEMVKLAARQLEAITDDANNRGLALFRRRNSRNRNTDS